MTGARQMDLRGIPDPWQQVGIQSVASALDKHRHPHPAADTHADQSGGIILTLHVVNRRHHLAGSGATDRMPDGNAAAKLIGAILGQLKFTATGDCLSPHYWTSLTMR